MAMIPTTPPCPHCGSAWAYVTELDEWFCPDCERRWR